MWASLRALAALAGAPAAPCWCCTCGPANSAKLPPALGLRIRRPRELPLASRPTHPSNASSPSIRRPELLRWSLECVRDSDCCHPSEPQVCPAPLCRPELLRWSLERVGDSGAGLGVRLSLGGVLFSGILAPQGGAASGGITPHHRPLSNLLGEAAGAAAAVGVAEVATRGLQPAVSGISSEQPGGSRRAGQHGTPAAASLAATGGRAAAVHASHW